MIIEINREEEAKIFDTDTGICYTLYMAFLDCPIQTRLTCLVSSIHSSTEFVFKDKEAAQIWQALSLLPGVNPGWMKYHLSRLQGQVEEEK